MRLTAGADYGMTGQYVARITGRSAKFGYGREFIGRKGGKRNETTEATVIDAGLYETCDVDKKGKDSTYRVIMQTDGELRQSLPVSDEDAMQIASALDAGREIESIVRVYARPSTRDASKTVYDIEMLTEATSRAIVIEVARQALAALTEDEREVLLSELSATVQP